jgi:hypothetical protein
MNNQDWRTKVSQPRHLVIEERGRGVNDLRGEDSTRRAGDEAEHRSRLRTAADCRARQRARGHRFAKAFAAAEQTLAQLETAIAEDQIALFLALGGGWSEATEQTESRETAKQ